MLRLLSESCLVVIDNVLRQCQLIYLPTILRIYLAKIQIMRTLLVNINKTYI